MSSILTCISWVPRGIAAEQPSLEDITEEQVDQLRKLINEASVEPENHKHDSDEEPEPLTNNPGGMFYSSNTEDPLLQQENSDNEDIADLTIPQHVYLLIAGKVNMPEREGFLEQWKVDHGSSSDSSVELHHDRVLKSAPICVEWMGVGPGGDPKPHLAAVGYMEPGIEIWNMNDVTALEPVALLGSKATKSLKTSKKRMLNKKSSLTGQKATSSGHKGATMNLSWNRLRQNLLASSGDDSMVFIWDLNDSKQPIWSSPSSISHTKPVQTIDWSPFSESIILTSSFDKRAQIVDLRQSPLSAITFSLSSDAESADWIRSSSDINQSNFLIGCDDGSISSFDPRNPQSRLFMIDAHKSSAIVASHPRLSNLLISGGSDKCLKAWSLKGEPVLIHKENVKETVGEVFCVKFNEYADDQSIGLVAAGGSEGEIHVFDCMTWQNVISSI
ncbi:hypothetical protein RCL1_003038 [Eukaryota sp. TZLM3-RCL]